ncbi:MAG: hypothetical protein KAJ55_10675 [Anaerolineales bacterium]|nr:hypothetical protein [Anaerolineales bacterium]
MNIEEDTLSSDLAAAWDESENVSHETPEEPTLEATPDNDETPEVPEEPVAVAEEPAGDTSTGEGDFAPKSLSAKARETWSDVPEAMKQEIMKREADYQTGIQKYAENAKRAEQMDQALAPFQQLFAMNGGPGETLPGLLQTASILQMGSPVQRAEMVAQLISQFGVDVATLDGILSGQGVSQQAQQQNDVQQAIQQAMEPYQQFMHQQQMQTQQQQQQQQHDITADIQRFASDPKNEFYNDVRGSMADIMDLAAGQGREMSLQEAYDTACQLNPEIRGIIQTRQQQEQLQQSQRAGSSIHGTPGGEGAPPTDLGLRQAIESAWDNAGRI